MLGRSFRTMSTIREAHPKPIDPIVRTVALSPSKLLSYTIESFGDDAPKVSKPKIVLLHGGPGSHADFRYISGALKKLKEEIPFLELPNVIRVDLPGHGNSSRGKSADSHEMASSVLQALTADNITPPYIVVGHSLGGHAALEASRLEGVVGTGFIAPVSLSVHKGIRPLWLNKWFGERSESNAFTKALTDFTYKNILKFPARHSSEEFGWVMKRVASIDFERARELTKDLSTPWFLTYANDDHLIEKEIFREFRDELKKKTDVRGKIMEFEGGGHNVQKTRGKI